MALAASTLANIPPPLQGSVSVALAASALANILQSLPEWCTLGGGQAGADLARLVGLGFGV